MRIADCWLRNSQHLKRSILPCGVRLPGGRDWMTRIQGGVDIKMGRTSSRYEGSGNKSYGLIDFRPSRNPFPNIFRLTSRNFWGVTRSIASLSLSWGKGNLEWDVAKPMRAIFADWGDPISLANWSAPTTWVSIPFSFRAVMISWLIEFGSEALIKQRPPSRPFKDGLR